MAGSWNYMWDMSHHVGLLTQQVSLPSPQSVTVSLEEQQSILQPLFQHPSAFPDSDEMDAKNLKSVHLKV